MNEFHCSPSSTSAGRQDPFFTLQTPSDTKPAAKFTPSSGTHTFKYNRKDLQNHQYEQCACVRVCECVTQSAVGDAVHLQDEVILKEHVSNNREEVDQDQTQNSCQDNRAAVSGHTLDYVQKSLFPVHQVKQLHTHTQRFTIN